MSTDQITERDIRAFREDISEANAIDLYQHIATKSAIYPGQETPLGLLYVALKLNGEAGEVAEHVGKAMRDDDLMGTGGLTLDRRASIVKELGDVAWYLSALCNELHVSLADVLRANLEKLHDRTERHVLRGSGDRR